MISMEKIDSIWRSILPQNGINIARRADPEHPLDYFIGYDENGNMQMMLVAESQPALPKSSQQILVRSSKRNDEKYAICFSLTSTSLRDTFISLCWDIMNCTCQIESKNSGVLQAIKRFGMWQILLAKDKNTKISDSILCGLLSELFFLREICIPRYGKSRAISGWIGPFHADRDFEYEDTWFEVKSVSLSKEKVSISSFDQLDIDRTGYLIICRLEKTSEFDPKALTLNSLVSSIENDADDEQDLSTLLVKLKLNGYNSMDERANEPFVIHGFERYIVCNEFPRIRRNQLHPAICNGEYVLSIAGIQTWIVE